MAAASTGKLRRGEATTWINDCREGDRAWKCCCVGVGIGGGTLQRSRTPRNGDVWQI